LARAIVVADPQFEAAQGGSGRNENLRELQTAQGVPLSELKLAPLPESRAEATGVAAALMRMGIKTEVLLGEQATLDAFAFKEAPRILHVATHGLYLAAVPKASGNSQNVRVATIVPGLQSALALTPNAEGSLLTGGALARLPLRGTELVVLSACDTGNGSVDVGEGVASLRRAVEEAGGRSVIASLWPVPSRATTALMLDFYTWLAGGASKSEALREAKLAMRRESPDPLQWAGFLLSGAP
jgi:CHAT domain-containing protein